MEKDRASVKLQVTVEPELAERIEYLAGRLDVSVSRMSALLLDAAVRDEAWIIEAVTSRFARSVAAAFGISKSKGGKVTPVGEA